MMMRQISVPEVSVAEAATMLREANPPRLIDVREADEWAICHVEGAELLPLSGWPAAAAPLLEHPDAPLLILCHHGGRSARATQFLRDNGSTGAVNVAGGIDLWAQEIEPGMARY
jgi:rhodanese-related sulfurtransferase